MLLSFTVHYHYASEPEQERTRNVVIAPEDTAGGIDETIRRILSVADFNHPSYWPVIDAISRATSRG